MAEDGFLVQARRNSSQSRLWEVHVTPTRDADSVAHRTRVSIPVTDDVVEREFELDAGGLAIGVPGNAELEANAGDFVRHLVKSGPEFPTTENEI